jgi:uncharacterized protein (TIGR00251 family)
LAEEPDRASRARAAALAIRASGAGVLLRVRVKPKARTDAILGVYGDSLKLSVKEAPERGKANEAVCRLLARSLGIVGSAVTIASGETSQDKVVQVDGLAADACRARIEALLP